MGVLLDEVEMPLFPMKSVPSLHVPASFFACIILSACPLTLPQTVPYFSYLLGWPPASLAIDDAGA